MSKYFSPFVIPFCIGVVLLFAFCIWKYIRWYKGFDRLQRAIIRKNIKMSLFEGFFEGLIKVIDKILWIFEADR